MRPVAVVFAVIAALAGLAVAVSMLPEGGGGAGAVQGQRVMTSQAYYVWGDTPRDWVSWADRIAVVEVLGEEQVPFEPREFEGGSGWVARRIHAKMEDTIWARPGYSGGPQSLKVRTTDGWWYKESELIPIKDVGAHRSEVGDRLLVAMIHSKKWGWTLMSGGIPVDPDARLRADLDQTDIGKRLDGMTKPQLAETFRTAKPFTDVIRFRHLDLEERMIAVHKHASTSRAAPREG